MHRDEFAVYLLHANNVEHFTEDAVVKVTDRAYELYLQVKKTDYTVEIYMHQQPVNLWWHYQMSDWEGIQYPSKASRWKKWDPKQVPGPIKAYHLLLG